SLVFPPALSILTNDGQPIVTNNPVVTLNGVVTPNAEQVQVNGSTAGVAFSQYSPTWSFTGSLSEGMNTLSVQAFGPGGESAVRSISIRLDSHPPVLTLRGENPLFVPLGNDYVE